MKKLITLIFFVNVITNTSNAQVTQILNAIKPTKAFEGTPILDKKSFVFSVGLGIPNNTNTLLSGGGIITSILGGGGTASKQKGVGPLFAGFEYFISKELSLGLGITYATGKQNYTTPGIPLLGIAASNAGSASINLFQIAGSSSYHLYTTDKLDPYIKGAIGINLWKTKYVDAAGKESNPFTAPTPFAYQGIVGLRYFVNKHFAPYGEIGYTSLKFSANLGLSVKL